MTTPTPVVLDAPLSPWLLLVIAILVVAGVVLLALGLRRTPADPGRGEETAESLGLREPDEGREAPLDEILTDQTFVDGNAPARALPEDEGARG